MDNNILVTSIGSFSTDCVIKSLKEFLQVNIYGSDIYPSKWHAVSSQFDQVFQSPLVAEENEFFNFITKTCSLYNIKTIIPLTDLDVDFFNTHSDYFRNNGITITIANKKFIQTARDKYNLYKFSKSCSTFKTVNTYTIYNIDYKANFPIIAKPKNGRSSQGIHYLNKLEELHSDIDYDNYIFQEIVRGDICTVDYIRDAKSKISYYIPRLEHIRTSNGAGLTVETFYDSKLELILDEIGNSLNINGCINLEFIKRGNDYYLIDINPRFSAGIGFSVLSGYSFVRDHYKAFHNQVITKPELPYRLITAQKVMTDIILSEASR